MITLRGHQVRRQRSEVVDFARYSKLAAADEGEQQEEEQRQVASEKRGAYTRGGGEIAPPATITRHRCRPRRGPMVLT